MAIANLKIYSGSTFVDPTEIKVYNGSAFVDVGNVYIRDSGAWVEVWNRDIVPAGVGPVDLITMSFSGSAFNSSHIEGQITTPDIWAGTDPFPPIRIGDNQFPSVSGPGGTTARTVGRHHAYNLGGLTDFYAEAQLDWIFTTFASYTSGSPPGNLTMKVDYYNVGAGTLTVNDFIVSGGNLEPLSGKTFSSRGNVVYTAAVTNPYVGSPAYWADTNYEITNFTGSGATFQVTDGTLTVGPATPPTPPAPDTGLDFLQIWARKSQPPNVNLWLNTATTIPGMVGSLPFTINALTYDDMYQYPELPADGYLYHYSVITGDDEDLITFDYAAYKAANPSATSLTISVFANWFSDYGIGTNPVQLVVRGFQGGTEGGGFPTGTYMGGQSISRVITSNTAISNAPFKGELFGRITVNLTNDSFTLSSI